MAPSMRTSAPVREPQCWIIPTPSFRNDPNWIVSDHRVALYSLMLSLSVWSSNGKSSGSRLSMSARKVFLG
jgi:hypothetical protein